MTPSIHKVPACPFTALRTLSHCADDHVSCVCCTTRHIKARFLFFFVHSSFLFTPLLFGFSSVAPSPPSLNQEFLWKRICHRGSHVPLHRLIPPWLKKHAFLALIRILCSPQCVFFVTFCLCLSGKQKILLKENLFESEKCYQQLAAAEYAVMVWISPAV